MKNGKDRLVVAPMIMPPRKALRQAVATRHRWLPISEEPNCPWCGMIEGHIDDCELAQLLEKDKEEQNGYE